MLPSREAGDLIAGMWALPAQLGRVPRTLVWDNEPAVGSWRGGKPQLAEEFAAFRGSLGVRVYQCAPRDPEAKGMVERANGYLETSFEPGRSYTGPADFNAQSTNWLSRANQHIHRGIRCPPRTGRPRTWKRWSPCPGPGALDGRHSVAGMTDQPAR
jgi:hypothetical protein